MWFGRDEQDDGTFASYYASIHFPVLCPQIIKKRKKKSIGMLDTVSSCFVSSYGNPSLSLK